MTESVRIFVYKKVTEKEFFAYKNIMESALFFVYKNVTPPSANVKNSTKNRVTQSVRFFVNKKGNANCLAFCELSGFLYIKTSRNANCRDFFV